MHTDKKGAPIFLLLGAALLVLGLGTGTAVAQQPAGAATADIRDRLSRFIGTTSLREEQGGVHITGFLRNLAPGSHGLRRPS